MLTSIGRCGIAEEPPRAQGAVVVSPRATGGRFVSGAVAGAWVVAQGARVGSMLR